MNLDEKKFFETLKNKKIQWAIIIIAFLIVLYLTGAIRFSNWGILNDSITGEKLPSDLDAFYFLRISETIEQNGGHLPQYDYFRYSPGFQTQWHPEIMPYLMVYMHHLVSSSYTIAEVVVASPAIFFVVGLIIFFLLISVISDR
ncbi:MAG: hypothetical protein Q8N88_00965, partial [Nanoarchaeota archaeon]|nr:hypothetical protein [Nanoarchaeota archaeon]